MAQNIDDIALDMSELSSSFVLEKSEMRPSVVEQSEGRPSVLS